MPKAKSSRRSHELEECPPLSVQCLPKMILTILFTDSKTAVFYTHSLVGSVLKSILIGCSLGNHLFWGTTIFYGNPQLPSSVDPQKTTAAATLASRSFMPHEANLHQQPAAASEGCTRGNAEAVGDQSHQGSGGAWRVIFPW